MDMDQQVTTPMVQMKTTAYIEALPEGKRAELINGRVYDMGAPGTTHQRIVHGLDVIIGNYINSNHGKCEVFPAPFAVYINDDKWSYLEPDLSVICAPEKIDEKGCHGAPDWVLEVVSPSSRQMDYILKLITYRAAGVREYWIIDPDKQVVLLYHFEGDEYGRQYLFTDDIPVGIYPGFTINIADMMAGR